MQRILVFSPGKMKKVSEKFDLDADLSALLDLPALDDSIFSAWGNSVKEGEKYIPFYLDEKLYAVHFKQVIEANNFLSVAPLPFVPAWLGGIANLRGEIIPVVDLRKLWKKETAAPTKTKFLIMRSEKDNQTAAFIVDKLGEQLTLAPREIEFSAADFESSFPTFFGRAAHKSQTVFLLDSESLFSSLEMKQSD